MAIYDAAVVESASISASRNIGGGFSTGGFASGAFDNLGSIFATVSGDLFLASVVVNSLVSELATGTDLMGITRFTFPLISESATAIAGDIDNIVNVNISVSELVTVSNTINAFLSLPASVSESAQIALTPLSPRVGFLCLANESAQGSETVATRVVFRALAAELAVATDIINTTANMKFGVTESVVILDLVPTNAVYNIPLSDSVLLSDQVNARLLWEPVNTSETTDWNLIDTVN
jgi:hypothetical protein